MQRYETAQEGTRIKHSVDGNSVKSYDKAYTSVGNIYKTCF